MSKDFKIYQDGDKQIIERLTYPKFKGVISPTLDIEDIEVDKNILDAGDLITALREAGDFIINYDKTTGHE